MNLQNLQKRIHNDNYPIKFIKKINVEFALFIFSQVVKLVKIYDVLANQCPLHQDAMGSFVWTEGQRHKDGENCREEKSIFWTGIFLRSVVEDEDGNCVEEDYCNCPECVVAQEPPAEGKGSCPEGDVGEEEEQGSHDRVA